MKRGLNQKNSLPDTEFGGESSESARATHYVVQKDVLMTYVSAFFAQADPGIVSGSTIERKQMSTKTSFKRIALVAVAALGAGLLSVAPANAETNPFSHASGGSVINENTSPAVDNQTISATASTTGTVVLEAVATTDSYETITVTATGATPVLTAASRPLKTGTGIDSSPDYCAFGAVGSASGSSVTGTRFNGSTIRAASIAESNVYSWSATPAPGALCAAWISAGTNATITVPTTTAGTINITIAGTNGNNITTLQTFTILVATSSSTDYAKTRVVLNGSANGWGLNGLQASDGAWYSPASNGVRAVKIELEQQEADGDEVSDAKAKAVEVTLAGVGYLRDYDEDEAPGVTRVTDSGDSDTEIRVISDGRGGLATVTIKVNDVVVKTVQVKFYGAPKTITMVPFLTIGKAGGGETGSIDYDDSDLNEYIDSDGEGNGDGDTDQATSSNKPAYGVIMKDANGYNLPNSNWSQGSSNSLVIGDGCSDGFLEDGSGLYSAGQPWVYHCAYETASTAVSGQTANITATYINTDGSIITASMPITIGGSVSTVAVTFNASSYVIGAPAVITLTAKDSAGNPVFDGATPLSSAGLVSNLNTAGTSFGASAVTKGGTVTVSTFAPVVTGTWTVSGKSSANVAVTASASVTSSADITALTTLVNSLIAKMNALNKLVIKIQKKVKAK